MCVLIKQSFSSLIMNERPPNHRQPVRLSVRKTGVRVFVRECGKVLVLFGLLMRFLANHK